MADHEEGEEAPTNETNAHNRRPRRLPRLPRLPLLFPACTHRAEGGEWDLEEGQRAVTAECQCQGHADPERGEVYHTLGNCGTNGHWKGGREGGREGRREGGEEGIVGLVKRWSGEVGMIELVVKQVANNSTSTISYPLVHPSLHPLLPKTLDERMKGNM